MTTTENELTTIRAQWLAIIEAEDYIMEDCGDEWHPQAVHKKYYGMKYCGRMDLQDLNCMFNYDDDDYADGLFERLCCQNNDKQIEKLKIIENNEYCDITLLLKPYSIENVITVKMSLYMDRVFMFDLETQVDEDNIDDYPEPHNIMNMIDNIDLFVDIHNDMRDDRNDNKKYSKTLRKKQYFYKVLQTKTTLPNDCINNIMKFYCY